MAINFEKKTPDWENIGAEPDAELKKGGFRAGYKPPAAYFNWFFNRISACVKAVSYTHLFLLICRLESK